MRTVSIKLSAVQVVALAAASIAGCVGGNISPRPELTTSGAASGNSVGNMTGAPNGTGSTSAGTDAAALSGASSGTTSGSASTSSGMMTTGASGVSGSADTSSGEEVSTPDGGDAEAAPTCAAGLARCSGNTPETCTNGQWQAGAACGTHQTCIGAGADGGAAASCTCNSSQCTEVGNACQDSKTVVTCAKDTNGCFYVASTSPSCTAPESCSGMAPNAACSLTCTDSCTSGQASCVPGGRATCALGSNGCWAYGTPAPCTNGACSGGTCCTNACTSGATQCAGTGLQTCEVGSNGCTAWTTTSTCPNGACSAGACCTDACTSGATQCASASSLQTCGVGSNGCLQWGTVMACSPSTPRCANNSCAANPSTYTIGGTVTGLSSSLVLANGSDQLTISGNGTFGFANKVASGQSYSVSVYAQPNSPAQTCTVTNGSGTATADVSDVQIDCPPFVVASGLYGPNTLRSNGSNLYFATTSTVSCYSTGTPVDSIMMLAASGGTPLSIAPVDHYAGNCGAYGIVFDATFVYWANYADATISRATLAGANPTPIFDGGQYMNALAIDATDGFLFYHQYPNSSIGRVTTAGSGNTTFANAASINGENMATDSSNLYWTDYSVGTVSKVPFNASSLPASPTTIVTGESSPQAPFVSASTIYWIQPGSSGALRYTLLASPSAQSLATGLLSPIGTVADSNAAWVLASGASASDGRVYKVPLGGGTPEIVAMGLYEPNSIVMDASHIYWANNNTSGNMDGAIMMIVK